MTALVGGRSEEEPFTSDVVSESVDLTSPSTQPSISIHHLQSTINELERVTPEKVLSISQLQRTLATLQGSSEDPTTTPPVCQTANLAPALQRTSPTTLQDVREEPASTAPVQQMPNSTVLVPRTPLTTRRGRLEGAANQQNETTIPAAHTTPLTDTPRNISHPRRDLVARPTVGGKCPRRVLPHPSTSSDEEEYCASCITLKKRVRELEDQLKSFQGQGTCKKFCVCALKSKLLYHKMKSPAIELETCKIKMFRCANVVKLQRSKRTDNNLSFEISMSYANQQGEQG